MSIILNVTQEELKKNLQGPDPVHFSYQKADGTIRSAIGTLHPDLIPESKRPKNEEKNFGENIKYFDLEKIAWRSLTQDCSLIQYTNIPEDPSLD